MNTNINDLLYPLMSYLPSFLGMILLIIIAFVLASISRKVTVKGLEKIDFNKHLKKLGVIKEEESSKGIIKNIGQLVYFLVILFFLPSILSGLNISSSIDPISSMFAKFFAFIPNLIAAGLIIFVGTYFCNFIKILVKGLLERLNIDSWYKKVTGQESVAFDSKQIINVLASVVYVLIFIPILTLALETLGITSISQPIVGILNQVFGIIPSILVAVMLLLIGSFVAKLVSNLLEGILKTSGLDQYSSYLTSNQESKYKISFVVAQAIRAILITFFFVQALAVLKLDVLNQVGNAIIAYLPSLISSILIIILAVIGGNILASFLTKVTDNKVLASTIRYSILVLAIFMALDQLKFAQNIVTTSFTIILGAFAVAFALAFGLGGRDFAAKQLDKLDKKIDKNEK